MMDRQTSFSGPRLLAVFLSLVLSVGWVEATAGGVDWDSWEKSVIRLWVEENGGYSTGSAFAVNDNGDYITNHHVIESAMKGGKLVAVESMEPEKVHPAKIVWHSEEYDLAMVHVETWKNKALPLSSGDLLTPAQDVFTIGFPGAADRGRADFTVPTLKKGVFSAFKTFPLTKGSRGIKMIEHDAAVNSGNSGGPLADACGRVVGVNEQKTLSKLVKNDDGEVAVNTNEGILFSINSTELMALLDKNKVKYQRDDSACIVSTAASTSNPVFIVVALAATLSLIGLGLMYRRIQQASPNGHFDSKVLSRMIRERIGGKSDGPIQDGGQNKGDRSYFNHDLGRIVHRDEHNPPPSPPKKVGLRLVPKRGDLGLPVLSFSVPGNYRLGRASQGGRNQLVVPSQYVSSEHLLFTVNPDFSVVVEDLGSMNGTQISGAGLGRGQLHPLQVGQSLRLGHDEVTYTLQRG